MKLKSLLFLFFLFLFAGIETAYACMCFGQQACQSYADADAVFVGKVVDFTYADKKIKSREQLVGSSEWEVNEYVERRQISRLKISEIFTGIKDEKEIFIETEVSSSCGMSLSKDTDYLIYARKVDGEDNLRVFACAGTTRASNAEKDLEYLRANKNASANVSGKVEFEGAKETDSNVLAKSGVTTISLENDEKQVQTTIKPDGSYKFEDVLSGKYRIKIILPESLTTDEDYHPDIAKGFGIEDQSLIKVSSKGCSVKNFFVKENGRISGRVTDAAGNPIKDIQVYLIPVSKTGQKIKQEELCYDTGLCLSTDKNGEYSIKGLKAGNYLVGIRLGKYVGNTSVEAAYFATFYPSVTDEKEAIPVKIKVGQTTKNIDLKLTKKYVEREIKGRVFFSDGRPAANVRVRYATRTPDFKSTGLTFIKTDDNGYFNFKGYENYAYLIGAFTNGRSKIDYLEAKDITVEVVPEKEIKEIKLILDKEENNKCEDCVDYFNFPKTKPKPNDSKKNKNK